MLVCIFYRLPKVHLQLSCLPASHLPARSARAALLAQAWAWLRVFLTWLSGTCGGSCWWFQILLIWQYRVDISGLWWIVFPFHATVWFLKKLQHLLTGCSKVWNDVPNTTWILARSDLITGSSHLSYVKHIKFDLYRNLLAKFGEQFSLMNHHSKGFRSSRSRWNSPNSIYVYKYSFMHN